MINAFSPALLFLLGALFIPLFKGRLRNAYLLLLPLAGFALLLSMQEGAQGVLSFLEYQLVLVKVDRLSRFFGYIYLLITAIALVYAFHVKESSHHMASLFYAGSALGVVFAGDFLTLFIFWETMALSAAFLVWSGKTKNSAAAGIRYLLVHILGGLFLLMGIILHVHETGSLAFGYLGLNGLSSWLILIGFGVNCAFPGLHAWLPDAYPETSPAGGVFMWTFTTKTAVYVLARAFPGEHLLVWIGVTMTVFPIFFAVLENNLRRVLSYSLINQLGYMVTGIGIGTQLSLNGTVAHVFCHILYKALLVMSMGAVIYRTGKTNATDLGGLYKSMPLTTLFCIIGAASISAFPLFSGFVSKSMVVEAAALGGMTIVSLMLLFASVGVLEHAGIKVPFHAFFSHDAGIRTKEAPLHMLVAMGAAAVLSVLIGVYPAPLYRLLPYPVEFAPYTPSHVLTTMQLLLFGAFAYVLLIRSGIFPAEVRATNLDTDWFYRKGTAVFLQVLNGPAAQMGEKIRRTVFERIPSALSWFGKNPLAVLKMASDRALLAFSGPEQRNILIARLEKEKNIYPGDIIKHWPVGTSVLWATLLLLAYLLLQY
ncbi:MAG: Na(+)/H(+) antiporter subunit D [Nitrospirota bacterium]|nr:Na(+)/H(+) antiporter subunit D [Nitrospirota bacterium]